MRSTLTSQREDGCAASPAPECSFPAETPEFRADLVAGLTRQPKRVPSKYFYDRRGSLLFDQICETPEYYVTRCELEIMETYASDMAAALGESVLLVEYGSGSSIKTRLLLDELNAPAGYVPVDVSREHLHASCVRLRREHPNIEVAPVCADFTQPFALPRPARPVDHAAVYFPGSTIGNFTRAEADQLVRQIAHLCGRQGGLLLGVDLKKDPQIIELAYNDEAGVTAEFNRNLLHRANRELGADFDVSSFAHLAEYNRGQGRIESYLVSQREQRVSIGSREFHFAAGEALGTEYSHKYDRADIEQLAAAGGMALRKIWTDSRGYFAVVHMVHDD